MAKFGHSSLFDGSGCFEANFPPIQSCIESSVFHPNNFHDFAMRIVPQYSAFKNVNIRKEVHSSRQQLESLFWAYILIHKSVVWTLDTLKPRYAQIGMRTAI